ncbi:CerR family C-terminal domain-containing protein [Sphingopyxis granuli]|uniref:CerR family C-terminal domain-containing protein n=1 Tax=Sphingopyxis granuli TaxID=267128 RepID=UPI00082C178F|nr:CerR family C-terminal domain-containing protein [Sphingopyxis granuli]
MPRSATPATPLRTASDGYRKGEETRARILAVALAAFGNSGFASVTTRQIAREAGVNLPALTYYFGNKRGLYLACAHAIVARYREGMGAVALTSYAALQEPLAPDAARALLKRLFAALARFLLATPGAQNPSLFVQREIASPGPAFEILYAELWRPGIELATDLIVQTTSGQLTETEAQVRAVLMISSLTGFLSGLPVIARTAGKADYVALVIAALARQIDSLGRDDQHCADI